MNEELKIIITAETEKAQKDLAGVKSELGGIQQQGGKTAKGFGGAMKVIGAAAATAAAATVAAVVAIGAALVGVAKSTEQYREEQGKLLSAFQAMGGGANEAKTAYNGLYRFMGETDTAAEAAAHLAKLTTNEQELAQWTKICQGVFASYGDSLPIEGLTEAANETAKVGKVTGTLADALNWAGVSEDAFNASLAALNTEAEREAYIRSTLSGLYNNAAELYEKNNAAVIAQREAQGRLNESLAQIGAAAAPLQTSLTNLANAFLAHLAPAINAVMPYITAFIDAVSKAVNWVMSFINSLLGVKSETAENVGAASDGIANAATGAGSLASGLEDAAKAAAKVKRNTAGFDELNVMANNAASSGGGASTGGGGGAGVGAGVAPIETGLTGALEETAEKASAFGEIVKGIFTGIKDALLELLDLLTPTTEAWGNSFDNVADSWNGVKDDFANGATVIKDSCIGLNDYLTTDFTPTITNSFSENIQPMLDEIASFTMEDAAKDFQQFAQDFYDTNENLVKPTLENIKQMSTESFEGMKDAWNIHGGALLVNLGEAKEKLRNLWNEIKSKIIQPVIDLAKKFYNEVWVEHLKPLWDKLCEAMLDIGNNLLILWNKHLKPLISWFVDIFAPIITNAFNVAYGVIKTVIGYISDRISSFITIVKGVVAFITGVLTGDWKKAWNGIKDIFTGIWEGIVAKFKFVINILIGILNAAMSSMCNILNGIIRIINKMKITIPDWVPKIGGHTFSLNINEVTAPQIPKLAKGGITIGDTLAHIGENGFKEAVLPLEQNTEWMDMLADRLAARSGAPSKIVLMLDSKELGWANINSINSITRQTGQLQLNLV